LNIIVIYEELEKSFLRSRIAAVRGGLVVLSDNRTCTNFGQNVYSFLIFASRVERLILRMAALRE